MPSEVINAILSTTGTWFWEAIGKDFITSMKTVVQEMWQRFDWHKAEQSYRAKLLEQYSTIRVLGKSEPVELEGIFTDLCILSELTARRRFIEFCIKNGTT